MNQNAKVRLMLKKGQSFAEYFMLIAILVAGLISMQMYMKRSMQGRWRNYADQLSGGAAYSPQGVANATTVVVNTIIEKSHSLENITVSNTTFTQGSGRQEELVSYHDDPSGWAR